MTLDIFVGSLTRYYVGDWGEAAEPTSPALRAAAPLRGHDAAEVRRKMLTWRGTLQNALGQRLGTALEWDESDKAGFWSGRPGWDGFGALVLWAAYAEHPSLRRPKRLPTDWDDDPALVRSSARRSRFPHLVRDVELWLPAAFDVTFEAPYVDGRRILIGSVPAFAKELEALNAATWRAGEAVVARWRTAPMPVDSSSLEDKARHTFAIVCDLVGRADENRLPMKLDY